MHPRFLRNAVVLGLMMAIGPFAIDMYLPALPSIGRSLDADIGAVQMSLMAFFISLGVGQIIYGPVSDMIGRKAPLYAGLGIFAVGSVGCGLATDIDTLIAFRFLQGFGACAGMVVPRAIVRDLHTGTDAARLMSLLMLVFSVSPILAPLAGSVIIALAAYRTLLTDPAFLGLSFIGAFGISSFFAYLANSSFVLIEHYGLTPTLYSIAFSINAVSFIGAAQLTGWLGGRFGLHRVVRTAVGGYAIAMTVLLAFTVSGVDRLDVIAALLFVGYGFLGLVVPTTAVLALEEHGSIAGTASALMGTLQFVTGAAVIAVVGMFVDGTALPMVAGISGCALAAFVLAQLTLGRRRPVEAVVE